MLLQIWLMNQKYALMSDGDALKEKLLAQGALLQISEKIKATLSNDLQELGNAHQAKKNKTSAGNMLSWHNRFLNGRL